MRLWLVGCGAMAGAMLGRWLEAGAVAVGDVNVVNRGDRDLPGGVRQARTLPDGPPPDVVLLGMKPFQIDEVAAAHGAKLAGAGALVSILAGVEEAALAPRFAGAPIVRAMPNLPVRLGKGVVALHSARADAGVRATIEALMQPLGLVEWIEAQAFDVVTALAGSGPGFLYRFIDALAAGGVGLGLPADQAQRLAIATVEGAGLLAAASDASPAELAERVASPRGSTREGLKMLDADDALDRLVAATLAAATRRNREMAAEARG